MDSHKRHIPAAFNILGERWLNNGCKHELLSLKARQSGVLFGRCFRKSAVVRLQSVNVKQRAQQLGG